MGWRVLKGGRVNHPSANSQSGIDGGGSLSLCWCSAYEWLRPGRTASQIDIRHLPQLRATSFPVELGRATSSLGTAAKIDGELRWLDGPNSVVHFAGEQTVQTEAAMERNSARP